MIGYMYIISGDQAALQADVIVVNKLFKQLKDRPGGVSLLKRKDRLVQTEGRDGSEERGKKML